MIRINAPQIGKEEIEAVTKVLESGILTTGLGKGPYVTKFEKSFADFVQAKYSIAVNSGTAALHAALMAVGVKNGDEVLLPSFTFTATAETVILCSARPVFVDIDPETYCMDVSQIEKYVNERTKAIIPVDLYGFPADLQPLREIADKHGIAIVEDAAQAHGALYKGKPVGFYADVACWSFYASKNMTTGEGGMVTTNNEEIADKVQSIRTHGEKEKYMSVRLGHNYRMPEIEAAIGLVQLKKLPKFLEKRRKNAKILTEKLEGIKGLKLPFETEEKKHSWYLYTVRLENVTRNKRDQIVRELKENNIEAAVYYHTPIHTMPFYRKFCNYKLPETEKASEQVLSLPIHPGVSLDQISYIAEKFISLI